MKRKLIILLMSLGLLGCDQSPKEVYTDMATSAHFGDTDGFLKGFTANSKKILEGMIVLSEAYGMPGSNPYELLVYDVVVKEELFEKNKKFDDFKCPKPCAMLTVKSDGKKKRLLMLQTEDGWRIDIRALDKFWQTRAGQK